MTPRSSSPLDRSAPSIEVRIEDDGAGFTQEQLSHAFEPFRSGNSSTGLGLSVCKAIIEAHGGTIRAQNRPTGGACLTFTVPTGDPKSPDNGYPTTVGTPDS